MERQSWYWKLFTLEFIIAGLLCLSSILLFAAIADEVVIEQQDLFDARAFSMMHSITSPANTRIALFFTFFGSGFFLIPAYLLLIFYFYKKNKRLYSIWIGVVAVVSVISGWTLKAIFQRSRPLQPLVKGMAGYSFPSGHTLGGFTFCGVIIYIVWRSKIPLFTKWLLSLLLFLLGVLIGLSRIYLHVHFASDVLGSFLVTLIWLSICFILLQFFRKRLPAQ